MHAPEGRAGAHGPAEEEGGGGGGGERRELVMRNEDMEEETKKGRSTKKEGRKRRLKERNNTYAGTMGPPHPCGPKNSCPKKKKDMATLHDTPISLITSALRQRT